MTDIQNKTAAKENDFKLLQDSLTEVMILHNSFVGYYVSHFCILSLLFLSVSYFFF